MGGRGGSSHRATNSRFSFLGTQRTAFSILDSIRATNPNYHLGNEWQINCQRCVFAYEMRRRGYNVEAKSVPTNGSFDPLPYRLDSRGWTSLMKNMERTKTNIDTRTYGSQLSQAERIMLNWGANARAIVAVQWKSGGGHVFIAETMSDGRTVRFVDPQPGVSNVGHYFNQAKSEWTELFRVDNAELTERLDLAVQKKKKRR